VARTKRVFVKNVLPKEGNKTWDWLDGGKFPEFGVGEP
jgi:hypothetical protein